MNATNINKRNKHNETNMNGNTNKHKQTWIGMLYCDSELLQRPQMQASYNQASAQLKAQSTLDLSVRKTNMNEWKYKQTWMTKKTKYKKQLLIWDYLLL